MTSLTDFQKYKRSPINNPQQAIVESQSKEIEIPEDLKKYKREIDPDTLSLEYGAKTLGRTAKSVGSTLVGLPGDLENLLRNMYRLGHKAVTGRSSKEYKTFLPTSEEVKGFVEEKIPSLKPKTPSEKQYEEAVEMFAGLATPAPGGKIKAGRALLGTALGMGGKEVARSIGASEGAQDITKAALGIIPLILEGKLVPKKGEIKELYETGKKFGFTDKELTPLLQSERKFAQLSKRAAKTESAKNLSQQIQTKFGENVFEPIRERATKLKPLEPKNTKSLQDSMYQVLERLESSGLPTRDKKEAINIAEEFIGKLEKGSLKGEEIIDTFRDINKTLGPSLGKTGEKPLVKVKNELVSLLQKSDPELAKDLQNTNKLYQNQIRFRKQFGQDVERMIEEGIISSSERAEATRAILSGNAGALTKLIGSVGMRRLKTARLTSPQLQNILKGSSENISKELPKGIYLGVKPVKKDANKSSSS